MTTTHTPRRIQRKRSPGWRLAGATTNPRGAVIVSRPSRFGNPFTVRDAIEAEWSNPRRAVTANFAEWLRVGTEVCDLTQTDLDELTACLEGVVAAFEGTVTVDPRSY